MRQLINGFEMNFEDVGDGPPVLLVHGFPLNRTMWSHQIKALRSEYRIITPDLRGHGESEAPTGPYTMAQMAEDLYLLLREREVDHVVLGGLSMGGYVAFAFWRIHPDMVRALVLADTRAAADTPEGRENRFKTIETAQTEGPVGIFEDMLPKMLSPYTLENRPHVVEQTKRMMTSTPVTGVVGALQGMAQRPDSTPTLPTIRVPKLILVGEDDEITPPSEAEAMQEEMLSAPSGRDQHCELVRVPQAGHLAPLENPTVVNQALKRFLSTLAN